MSYRFKHREPLARGFMRVAREELQAALVDLGAASGTPPGEEGIHEARRRMKKLRALLRLMHPALGEETFTRENSVAREARRGLSPARDAAVRLATLDGLLDGCAAGEAEKFSPLRRRFARALPRAVRTGQVASPVEVIIVRLRQLLAEFQPASVPDDAALVCESLQRTYRRARRCLAAVKAERTDATLHALRKRVKDLQYQILLVRRAVPEHCKHLFRQLDRLGDDLGLDHDLAVLAAALAPEPAIDEKALTELSERLEQRRRKLQRSALRLASKVFAQKPTAWVKPIARAWERWHEPS